MGIKDQPAVAVQHALNIGFDILLVPAACFQRNDIELRQVHPADIDARMHAARRLEARGKEALGARADPAKGEGVTLGLAAVQKGFQKVPVARGVRQEFRIAEDRSRLMAKAVAADFVARRRQFRQVAAVIEHRAFDSAAAKAARRIISAAHPMAGQHRAALRPGILGKIIKRDAGDRLVPRQAGRPPHELAGQQAGQLDFQVVRQGHGWF